jgi:hypothetical protein
MFNDDGQCDADKLAIADGVCAGSLRGGRNVTKNDLDERLRDENAKLQELIVDMSPDVFVACEMCGSGGDVRRCMDASCRFKQFHERMRGLGIEVTP